MHGRGVIPLKGSCGGKVYLWHLSDWNEDIINIQLGLLNEALHSYYIYTFITRYGLPLAFGWWLTSRTFAFGVFTTFTLIWKEKLVILLGKKFMYFNDGDCKILSSLFGFYIACLFTTTTSSYENEHGGPISTKARLHTQNCIVSERKDANILISFFCKEKKKETKTKPQNTIVTYKTTVWTQNIHVELFGYNIISQTVLSALSYQVTHKWNSLQAKSLRWFVSSTRADLIWEVGCFP